MGISSVSLALRRGHVVPRPRISALTTRLDLAVVVACSFVVRAVAGLGRLASYCKPRLSEALAPLIDGDLLVDCRSSTYATAWVPPAEQTVAVNVFRERDGKRSVVSHFAKHTRGELARHLLTRRGKAPQSPEQLLKAASELYRAELVPGTAREPHALNIVLTD